jgi:hypothetical protein
VRFVDFLKTTVILSGAAATALAAVTVVAVNTGASALAAAAIGAWWAISAMLGLRLGHRAEINPPIARLLASAKSSSALPVYQPGITLLNRLWALLLGTLIAGALAFLAPQVPAIGTGFALIGALAWRRQAAAVAAIEQRDGVRFHVMRTSPLRPIVVQRTPGFKAVHPERMNGVSV